MFNAKKAADEFMKEVEEKIEQNKVVEAELKEININDGEIYVFNNLEELVDMLKNDGYEIRLKIKRKRFRTTEVIL
ncbi:hypothetical protein [Clostridium perfringens]|uniref:hypothetical protein n=1 Tax=Clostridium perfringens TaxID=1502 RepID=UPI0039E81E93